MDQEAGLFPALRHREFRTLWTASISAAIAQWTLFLGANWLAYDLSGSSLAVGLVAFALMVPYFASPIGGSLADRFDRRRVLIITRAANLVCAVTLAGLAFSGAAAVWHLALLGFLNGLARATEHPAEQALIPNTVPPHHLLNAVTLASAAFAGSRVVGPLAGAPLLGLVGSGGVFALAGGFYLLSGLQSTRLQIRSTGDVEEFRRLFVNTGRTVRYIVRTGPVLMVFGLVGFHCWLTMSYDALLPDFATRHMHGGELEYNAVLVAVGAGALFATLGLSTISRPLLRGSLFLAAGIGSGVFPVLLALTGHLVSGAAAAIGIGASQAVYMALTATLLQSVVPDGMRGRVMSLYIMLAAGVMSLMNLLNGALADRAGTELLFALPGLAFVFILVGWALVGRELRWVFRTGELRAAAGSA